MGSHVFSSFRARLLLLVLLAVLPALALLLGAAADQRAQSSRQAQTEALRLASVAAVQHERSVASARQFLAVLAQIPEMSSPDVDACRRRLAELRAAAPSFANLARVGLDGRVFCSAVDPPAGFSADSQPWFQEIRRTGQLVMGEYTIGAISGRPVLAMAAPVTDGSGAVIGYAFGSLDLSWLSAIPAATQLPPNATLTVLDQEGKVLLRTPAGAPQERAETSDLYELVHRLGQGTAEGVGLDGVERLYGFTQLAPEGNGAFLVIGIPAADAYAEANRALWRNLLAFAGVALAAGVAAWFAGERLLLRYLRPLVEAAQRIGEGDLGARTGLPHRGHGEVSALAAAFDKMAATVQERDRELRRAAEERLAFERRLRQTQRLESLGVLAGGIAHDFNNLLAIIRGNASLALMDLPRDHELRELLDPIDQSARRATELTRQMLAYAGQGRLFVEPIDTAQLVLEACGELAGVLPEGVELRTAIADQLPPLVADPSHIRQLVLSLLLNAGEAMQGRSGAVSVALRMLAPGEAPRGECILAGAGSHGSFLLLDVADQGGGIAPADLERVFDPFYTTKFVGRGLGLAAVIGIVRTHEGALYLESSVGEGTAVRVLLPVSEPAPEPIAVAAAQA